MSHTETLCVYCLRQERTNVSMSKGKKRNIIWEVENVNSMLVNGRIYDAPSDGDDVEFIVKADQQVEPLQ